MIRGLFIGTDGSVQVLGEVGSLDAIIKAMREVLPQLEQQHRKAILDGMTEEQLMQALTQKKAEMQKLNQE